MIDFLGGHRQPTTKRKKVFQDLKVAEYFMVTWLNFCAAAWCQTLSKLAAQSVTVTAPIRDNMLIGHDEHVKGRTFIKCISFPHTFIKPILNFVSQLCQTWCQKGSKSVRSPNLLWRPSGAEASILQDAKSPDVHLCDTVIHLVWLERDRLKGMERERLL